MDKYRKLGWAMLSVEIMVVVFFGLAMFFYPLPYSWAREFLSALGMTAHPGGAANPISCVLFNTALVGAGAATAAYFIVRAMEFRRKLPRGIMVAAGIVSGAALAAIGLIPYDVHPELHNQATYFSVAIGLGIVMTLFQGDNIFGLWLENLNWCIFGSFVVAVWLCLNYLSRHADMLPFRPTGPFMQKMIVAFFLIYMIYQAAALLLRTRGRRP